MLADEQQAWKELTRLQKQVRVASAGGCGRRGGEQGGGEPGTHCMRVRDAGGTHGAQPWYAPIVCPVWATDSPAGPTPPLQASLPFPVWAEVAAAAADAARSTTPSGGGTLDTQQLSDQLLVTPKGTLAGKGRVGSAEMELQMPALLLLQQQLPQVAAPDVPAPPGGGQRGSGGDVSSGDQGAALVPALSAGYWAVSCAGAAPGVAAAAARRQQGGSKAAARRQQGGSKAAARRQQLASAHGATRSWKQLRLLRCAAGCCPRGVCVWGGGGMITL